MNEHAETSYQEISKQLEADAEREARLELSKVKEAFHYTPEVETADQEWNYLSEAQATLKDFLYQTGYSPTTEQSEYFLNKKKDLLVDGIVERGFKHSDAVIEIVNMALRGGTVDLDSADMNWRISERLLKPIENEKRARQADEFYTGLQELFADCTIEDDIDRDRNETEIQRFAWDVAIFLTDNPVRDALSETQLSQLSYNFCLGYDAAQKIISYTQKNLSLLTNLLP